MSYIRVIEIHGGTSGTEYMYVLRSGKLYHVSQLPGTKLATREGKRNRRLVAWIVPADVIAGSEGVWISFSREGRYCYEYYFRLPNRLEGVEELSLGEMIRRKFVDEGFKEPLKTLSMKGVVFELFGPEAYQLRIYEAEVPRLVEEFWRDIKSVGINNVYASGHAERTIEMLYDPQYAKLLSLALPSPQGRVRSLHEKITRAVELYILAKVLRALYSLGFRPTSSELWIEYATNRPAIVMRSSEGVYIHVFYQTPIVPHVISAFVEGLPKPFHVIPDIALVISDKEDEVGWLRDKAEKIALIVEVKFDLGYQTVYERPETAVNQIRTYRDLLGGYPEAVVVIYKKNPGAVYKLKAGGVECIDGVNPDNGERVEELVEFVKSVIERRLRRAV